ncbi:MAG: GAF domain-containing protein [Nitrospiraceae bacterium]|nr:GAF domain-containing protein [Nitrospiraceae bacterium]
MFHSPDNGVHEPLIMIDLLSREHRILEKPCMEHRPFGVEVSGRMIRDASGIKIRAYVDYLEETVWAAKGPDVGAKALDELTRLLNERIPDPAYHVTPEFLRNVWNSYSYEFLCFLGEFCKAISHDPEFAYKVGKEKLMSPIIQTLGRPFSLPNIYRMFLHFGKKFARGSLLFEVGIVTDRSAILRMKCTDEVYRQFGPYRRGCTELICQSSKGGLAAVPERIHSLPAAKIVDLRCMADGDEYCEWNISWTPKPQNRWLWPVAGFLAGGGALAYLRIRHPSIAFAEALIIALLPAVAAWVLSRSGRRAEVEAREQLIQEQLRFVEARHEELRQAYLEQQCTAVDLRRKIAQLTTLHNAGLIFSSTFDRESLLQAVMRAILHDLHYDRAMIAFYDAARQVEHSVRVFGVTDSVAALVQGHEKHVTDPNSLEGTVLLQGRPILVGDIRTVWDRLHPLNRQLALTTRAVAVISVPLKVKDRVIGSLTVDRTGEHSLTQEDLELMVTVAGQVATALDNAEAYHQIEALNAGLEAKVHERTATLEEVNQALAMANVRLREMDQLKSAFVSTVSHELRTPMTSIKGYVENLSDGLVGELTERQSYYLSRVKHNIERLTRMINDLLDLSKIEAGAVSIARRPVSIYELVADVVEGFQTMACERSLSLTSTLEDGLPVTKGDRDKLHQVLTNLIHNAMKFTPKGGEIRIEVRMDEDRAIRVCIADTGCGIHADDLGKIFDRFYRGNASTAESSGAGLGLAITKNLVELHGGRIWAESVPGEGSRFFVTLPVEPICTASAESSASTTIEKNSS